MTNQYLITPPPELVQQWADMLSHRSDHDVFSLAAQWGADQELEACIDWASNARNHGLGWDLATILSGKLRAARRPKPPSLKEQALTAMLHLQKAAETNMDTIEAVHIICRALETLDD